MFLARPAIRRLSVAILAALLVVPISSRAASERSTPLDAYVSRPDSCYSWKVARNIEGKGHSAAVLDLCSQSWRKKGEVDRTEWRHWLTVIRPEGLKSRTALLFITGGSHKDDAPKKADSMFVQIARATGSTVAVLRCVPNQPLVFIGDDRRERFEDDLLAHSWNKSIETGDDEWIGQFAMAKSAVRAMDAVEAYTEGKEGTGKGVERFVVSGASKRGWTTWLSAIVDKRVAAIIPIVIDLLNVDVSMRHHYAVYGFWSPAIQDYVEQGIMKRIDTPELDRIHSLVDPYQYRDRLTLPKFLINGSGDQYFLPDSSRFYFDGLPGEKYLRYVPNAGHGLKDSDAFTSLLAFYGAIVAERPRPRFSWTFDDDGSIRVKTQTQPLAVTLYQATNPKARDFRIDRLGPAWKPTALDASSAAHRVAVPKPEKGWTAFFVELAFDSGAADAPFKFTTAVRVTPDTEPFKDKPIDDNLEPESAWK